MLLAVMDEPLRRRSMTYHDAQLPKLTKHLIGVRPTFIFAACLGLLLSSCAPQKQTPEQVREKTAEATAEFKTNARAVVQGVREGWSRGNPLDLNSATKDQLMSLPGVTVERANRLIAGRPYQRADEVVSRHIISSEEYGRIKDQVTAKN